MGLSDTATERLDVEDATVSDENTADSEGELDDADSPSPGVCRSSELAPTAPSRPVATRAKPTDYVLQSRHQRMVRCEYRRLSQTMLCSYMPVHVPAGAVGFTVPCHSIMCHSENS
jgi:hypothetical protein